MRDLSKLYDAIVSGDTQTAVEVTRTALAGGIVAQELVSNYLIKAMDEVGRRFEAFEYFIPELLISAKAMKAAMELLRPHLIKTGAKPMGKVAIGTVKGDLHDIGKNLVASMLEGGGFEITDLGNDVPAAKIIEAVKANDANIVALSALLTTTRPMMKTTIDALSQAGLREQVKVMVGGPPVSQTYADEIGADGYSENANGAVMVARRLVTA